MAAAPQIAPRCDSCGQPPGQCEDHCVSVIQSRLIDSQYGNKERLKKVLEHFSVILEFSQSDLAFPKSMLRYPSVCLFAKRARLQHYRSYPIEIGDEKQFNDIALHNRILDATRFLEAEFENIKSPLTK